MGERRGGGCVMAVVTRIVLQHLQWLDPPGNYEVVCFLLFPSEVSRRFDEVTVHIGERDRWHSFILLIQSFFGISYRQLSMPKDLTLLKNKKNNVYKRLSHEQRIKIHYYCSCKQSVAVHTRWRRRYLTIDMFKFTDVTASHV